MARGGSLSQVRSGGDETRREPSERDGPLRCRPTGVRGFPFPSPVGASGRVRGARSGLPLTRANPYKSVPLDGHFYSFVPFVRCDDRRDTRGIKACSDSYGWDIPLHRSYSRRSAGRNGRRSTADSRTCSSSWSQPLSGGCRRIVRASGFPARTPARLLPFCASVATPRVPLPLPGPAWLTLVPFFPRPLSATRSRAQAPS